MTTFAIALTIAGCNSRSIADGAGSAAPADYEARGASMGSGSAAATGVAAAPAPPSAANPGGAVPVRPTDSRKLIRTGDLAILVDGVDGARARLEALAASVGGFVDRAEVEHAGGTASSATIVIRVPSDRFDEAMRRTRDLGAVTRDDSQAEDITDAFTDLSARLANSRHLEQRLLKLVDERTGGVSDLLEVERELARVRGEIEAAEGRLRLWSDQVALSRITISLQAKTTAPVVVAPPADPSWWARVTGALDSSVDALASAGTAVAMAFAASLPWLPFAALGLLLLRFLAIRALRRLRAVPTAVVAPPQGQ
ncbi:MAG: DUF4349 domain-containing protein [Deltaproteobacteria bacterium]|nr:DUF4349 domain-containing protein [Deltaproteobacteria bacterium]